jgi:hypothetical protein
MSKTFRPPAISPLGLDVEVSNSNERSIEGGGKGSIRNSHHDVTAITVAGDEWGDGYACRLG